ncbi:MAG: hypothetical protein AAGB03_12160, partial [Pseudomonadota bacterium]
LPGCKGVGRRPRADGFGPRGGLELEFKGRRATLYSNLHSLVDAGAFSLWQTTPSQAYFTMARKRHDFRLLKFLAAHLVYGGIGAVFFLGGLLYFDIAQLRTLMFSSSIGWLALPLLGFFLALTFGSVAMGTAIMSLKDRE